MMTSRATEKFSKKKNNNHSFLSVKNWKTTAFIRLRRRLWTHTFLNSKKGLKQRAHTLRTPTPWYGVAMTFAVWSCRRLQKPIAQAK